MFDRKSDYAINKKDPDAIVCKTVTGSFVRLSREDFTSEAEFQKWKTWSDKDYRLLDNECQMYEKRTLNLEKAPRESTAPSPEQLFMERYDQLDRERFCQLLLEGIDSCLTETQRRRLLKYYFEGMTLYHGG